MSYVPFDEVIATAQSTIKTATSNDKQIWRQWLGVLCLPSLGIAEEDVKVITLYPEEFSAPKPDDCRAIIEVSCFDENGCQLQHKFRAGGQRIYRDNRVAITANGTPNTSPIYPIPVDISETNYSLELGTSGENVHSIVVRYYFTPLDNAGLPMIRQDETLACIFFLRFMSAMRENNSQSEIAMAEQRWKMECDRVIARKKMYSLSPDKMKTVIQSVWMRQIPNFNFSQF